MRETVNPLLLQVLHRRRMLRGLRWSAAAWAVFGGLHIAVWGFAFEHTPDGWPRGFLGAIVWPLLLVATASFISMVVYAARWLLAPADPRAYDWLLEQPPASGPVSPTLVDENEDEPTIVRSRG